MRKEIVFERLAEDVQFWRKEFNKAMDELEKYDKQKKFRVSDLTIQEIINKAHEETE